MVWEGWSNKRVTIDLRCAGGGEDEDGGGRRGGGGGRKRRGEHSYKQSSRRLSRKYGRGISHSGRRLPLRHKTTRIGPVDDYRRQILHFRKCEHHRNRSGLRCSACFQAGGSSDMALELHPRDRIRALWGGGVKRNLGRWRRLRGIWKGGLG